MEGGGCVYVELPWRWPDHCGIAVRLAGWSERTSCHSLNYHIDHVTVITSSNWSYNGSQITP